MTLPDPPAPPAPPSSPPSDPPSRPTNGAGGSSNGAGFHHEEEERDTDPDLLPPTPPPVAELCAACMRFIASKYKVALDGTSDTLSLVDQYIREAREAYKARPES